MSLRPASAQQSHFVGISGCNIAKRWARGVQEAQQQRPSSYRARPWPLYVRRGSHSVTKAAERLAELGAAPAGQEPRDSLPPLPPAPPEPAGSPATGLVYLVLVALLWGSYTPALR